MCHEFSVLHKEKSYLCTSCKNYTFYSNSLSSSFQTLFLVAIIRHSKFHCAWGYPHKQCTILHLCFSLFMLFLTGNSKNIWTSICLKVSSRTMHIPWDDAGCLCPVGDFYNYAAPGEEPCGWEDLKGSRNESSLQDSSFWNKDATSNSDAEQDDVLSQRLTDGGYKEDLAAYCFYARKNYKKGEQVLLTFLISWKQILCSMIASCCPLDYRFHYLWLSCVILSILFIVQETKNN